MKLVLQSRDQDILGALKKYGVLSTPQICQWFFLSTAKTTALRRIRALEKAKYIKRAVPLDNGTNTWSLGFKGRQVLAVGPASHFSNRNSIYHDVLLNDIRRKLESFGLALDVTSEYEIKSEVFRNYSYRGAKEQLIPDALMFESVRKAPWVISLELELTIKSDKRYEKIFRQYGLKDSIKRIWYFCNSTNEINRVRKFARRHWPGLENRMWFSTVDEFLKEESPSLWVTSLGEWLSVSEVGFDNFKVPKAKIPKIKPAHTPAQGVSGEKAPDAKLSDLTKPAESQPNSLIPASLT